MGGIIPNRQPKLLPPPGKRWRGSCLGAPDVDHDPELYQQKYGHDLHLFRAYRFKEGFTEAQLKFIERGGILWYNICVQNWKRFASGQKDEQIKAGHIERIKSLAPAQVFVCIGHEADHKLDENHTAEDHKAMWVRFQDLFQAAGVDNVVWCMDFSVQTMYKTFDNIEAVWPGDGRVDWLFFNCFERKSVHRTKRDFTNVVQGIYDFLEKNSAKGHNYAAIPWGIGAMGTDHAVDDEVRKEFFIDAAKAMDDNAFPNLKALVYFDSGGCAISEDLMPAYSTYISSKCFDIVGEE